MSPRNQSHFPMLLAVVLALASSGARAELIKVSPFLTPQSAAASPAANAPLQYMGWIDTAEGRLFRVYDPARKIGSFLKMGEHDGNLDVVVKQHDADHDTLTVDRGGQTLTLPEHESKVASAGSLPQMLPSPMPMPNVSPAVIQTVVPNPTPADEQRRLEAVAQEVARRRAMREQAQQQAQMQGGQPVPPPMPPNVTRQDLQQQYPADQRANRRQR